MYFYWKLVLIGSLPNFIKRFIYWILSRFTN